MVMVTISTRYSVRGSHEGVTLGSEGLAIRAYTR